MTKFLREIDGYYYYQRRVPKHLKPYDSRRLVRISLKTSDPVLAAQRMPAQHDAVEKFWRELVHKPPGAGGAGDWRAAVATARAYGFAYRTVEQLEAGPAADLVERLQALGGMNDKDFAAKAPALLGGHKPPAIRISQAQTRYFELTARLHAGKAGTAQKKSETRTMRAVANFIRVNGDLPLPDIARRHILDFRNWWSDKIRDEGCQPDTANKDLIEIKKLMREVCRDAQIPLDHRALFEEIKFTVKQRSRPPFDVTFVQDKILGPGALATMNPTCRGIVYIVAECGANPKEILFLDLDADVDLQAEIPFIDIRPNKHRARLKTDARPRRIPITPLIAAGLQLLREETGRYEGEDSLSAAVNKYFAEHGMKPTPAHTFYSLRHTFKDRLVDAGAPDSIIDDLMGHASNKPKYGRGHQLQAKLDWMNKIAFKVPALD